MFKKIIESISKTRNKNKILFWYLFVIAVVLSYVYFFYNYFIFRSLLESWNGNSFWESFNASLLQDVAFFGFVGIFPIIFWSLSPDDYLIDKRIRFIANSLRISQDAEDHFYKVVKKNLSYFKESNISITFRDMRPGEHAASTFECEIEARHIVEIMCKHDDLDIEIKELVDFGIERDSFFGQKTHQYFGTLPLPDFVDFEQGKQQIFIEKGKIKKDSTLNYMFKYQIFVPESSNKISWNDHSFRFKMSRYSEKCNISIRNHTSIGIRVRAMIDDKESKPMFVEPKTNLDVAWSIEHDPTLSIPVPSDGIILFAVRPENPR